ncbi:acyl-CoA synthetase [Actinophytocola xinjiangensis]|uniref:Acyl-CoA synthetase n=1 Tax=Actinophytocola xinjiangensis TaxID=485602 RepID=A0A7Z0WMX9_9PSEU|nr:GNAT family N-acetyltransferase [Actinophytocola xinjiangensis]OLF10512.1 acyl-CoA synthetase [Actinophytocola xinjiangensis]
MIVTGARDSGVHAVLTDGRIVSLRELDTADTEAVRELHRRLSGEDRYLRFFGAAADSTLNSVAGLVSRGTDDRNAALGGYLGGRLIGVANYEVLADRTSAEVAMVVDGAVQARGLGTLLLEHLASIARRHGVVRFVAEVLAENRRMIQVFRDAGLPYRMTEEGPERHVEISLRTDERYAAAVDERDRVSDVASLASVLCPASVAVVGAGRRPGSVGHAVLRNLLDGDFTGTLVAVNPHADRIAGVACWPSVAELPTPVELAVVCVPAGAVPEVVEQCGRRGVRAVVVVSAGLSGTPLAARILASVRRHGMRLVGPNCVGVVNTGPGVRLDATFTRGHVPRGTVGVVTQSGGVGIALIESLRHLGLGVSTVVSTGDKYDVSGNDLLLWWRHDPNTSAAVLYLESFGNPRKFSRLAQGLAHTTPVLAVRSAASDEAQAAAESHTAAAATPTVTRDALFEQAGVIALDAISEVVDTLAALAWQPLPAGDRVVILSNAGGAGVLAADACVRAGLRLPAPGEGTRERLAALLPAQASVANPVDTTAGVSAEVLGSCLRVLLADQDIDAVLVTGVPTALGDPFTAVAGIAADRTKPVLVARPGQLETVTALVATGGGPPATASYADPAAASAVLGRVTRYATWRRARSGAVLTPDPARLAEATTLVREFLTASPGGGWLGPAATVRLLGLFGVPTVSTVEAGTAGQAAAVQAELGGPVVLKAIVTGVLHKSRAGGVLVDLRDESAVRDAFATFAGRFGKRLRGVTVQPMVEPGRELIVGVSSDEVFGPLVVFGLGGTDTDLIADRVARLTPVTEVDADRMVHGLRCSKTLFGPLPTNGLVDILTRTSCLADALPEVTELDLNPVVVSQAGCQVLDARVRLAPREPVDPLLRGLRT